MGHLAYRHALLPPRYLCCYSKRGGGLEHLSSSALLEKGVEDEESSCVGRRSDGGAGVSYVWSGHGAGTLAATRRSGHTHSNGDRGVPGHAGDYPRQEQSQHSQNYQDGVIDLPTLQ